MHELSFFRHSINLACLKIFRWWEIVAGVTPRKLARSPQVRLSVAAVASNIANRVLSASAFDMFSISFVSITVPAYKSRRSRQFLEAAEVLVLTWFWLQLFPLPQRTKTVYGPVREHARPEIKRLATGPKTRESFELMR